MYKADAAQTMKRPRVVATAFSSEGGFVRMTACVSDQCKACTYRAFRLEDACKVHVSAVVHLPCIAEGI